MQRKHSHRRLLPARRLILMIGALAVLGAISASAPLHTWVTGLIASAQPAISAHPVWGAVVFTTLAAVSSMLVFVSSVALIPVGVAAWGSPVTVFLLMIGWFVGGVVTFAVGRHLGHPAVRRLLSAAQLERYGHIAAPNAPFATVLLIQFAVPSDVAGYFFGIAGIRRRVYLSALALAELPYAVGSVYLGTAFVERNTAALVVVGALAIGVALWQWRLAELREA
ncbi:MAG: VTT domain-containing protein [Gemmatimonadota bacterium]|nr:VTT domain-containing protein [Gemmatimonadota bacterium]